MIEPRSDKNYKFLVFVPMLIFLGLYVGCGIVFAIRGVEGAFYQMPRYVAVVIAICFALLVFDRKTPMDKKINIFAEGAGSPGVMLLGIIVLLAGGFSSAATAMGGRESMVNLGISLIAPQFLIAGIFVVTCVISTCIGTSMGTQVAMIPVAIAIAQGAGLNVAMAGAATIAGAYFGDNLSMISDTTIVATKGVGAEMKDKFKMNFFIALPAAILTVIFYVVFGAGSASTTVVGELDYSIVKVLPYITVLATAIAGVNVLVVLVIGIAMCGVIGIATGSLGFFKWAKAVGAGMEDMFFLYVFASLIAGLIALMRYYGGIEWLVEALHRKIRGKKSCEYIIGLMSMAIAGTTLNNTVAIVITAPIAKELGGVYKIAPKRLASLMDIFACLILGLVPHDSSILLVGKYGGVGYLEILKYSYYPILLLIVTVITIQFGLLRTKEEKEPATAAPQAADITG